METNDPFANKPARQSVVNMNLSRYQVVDATETESRQGWVEYGKNNLYPNYLSTLAIESPTHSALCSRISKMIAGEGLESMLPATRTKIQQLRLNPELFAAAYDLEVYGGYYLQVTWNRTRDNVHSVKCLPFECCRIAVDKNDEVIGVWYSKDWSNYTHKKYRPVFFPKFDITKAISTDFEEGSPEEKEWQDNGVQVICEGVLSPGSLYYPRPSYIGSLNFIEVERQIGSYHVNNIMNGFFPNIIIYHRMGLLPPEEQDQVIRDWNKNASGTENSGVAIHIFGEAGSQGVDNKMEITAFPLTDADKQYAELSKEARAKILTSHGCTTPLLFGIRDEGGGLGSNKDEMITGYDLFKKDVVAPMQEILIKGFTKVLAASGTVAQIEIKQNELPESIRPKVQPAAQEPTKLSAVEKIEMTEKDSAYWLTKLESCGEKIDGEEWELLSETEVHDTAEEGEFYRSLVKSLDLQAMYLSADDPSEWGDSGLYKLRYAYSDNITADSRPFCKRMVDLSVAGVVYRYEDIAAMSANGVNGQFAPKGESTYDIFTWKGGVYCHHHWKRQIYFRKRGKGGKFLPNDGLKNDKRVANVPFVPQKGKESIAPIDTPTRGKLN